MKLMNERNFLYLQMTATIWDKKEKQKSLDKS